VVGSGAGFGIDVGILFKPFDELTLGLMARNLSCVIKDESFPAILRAGLAAKFFNDRLVLAVDVNTKKGVNKKEVDYQLHIGMECRVIEIWQYFADARYQFPEEEANWLISPLIIRVGSDRGNLSAGLGLRYKMIQIDYAYSNETRYTLGYTHRYSIRIRF
jgi:hypothetical protein